MTRSALFIGNFLSAEGRNRTYSEDLTDRLEHSGWRVYRASTRFGRSARLVDMLATTWRHRADYAVAHVDVFSGSAFLWAEATCTALRALGKRFVLTLRGGSLPEFSKRWPRRVERLMRAAHAVMAPSGYLQEALRRFRPDIEVLPNALAIASYPYRVRRAVGNQIVWLRAFHAVYNPVLAVDVLARIPRRDLQLTMIGVDKQDGSHEATLARARELGVAGRVKTILGVPKSEVPAQLAAADLFLNTTNVDNSPVSVLEAMACGLCIVSTDVGGLPYLVSHEKTGLLAPPGDAGALAQQVTRALEQPQLAARLSSAAHAQAAACDWAQILPRWDALLGGVTAHG